MREMLETTAAARPAPPRRVASLLGHRQVDMAILCLGSLLRCSVEPLALRLHDDGSLTSWDRERLCAALGDPEVISRAEADERVADVLSCRPALAAFRRGNPLALKLIDAVLAAGPELAYCDTDILFLRRFTGLFPAGAGAAFMADHQNAYSLRSWHLLRHPRLRLPARVNTGLIHFPAAAWDPDLLEWYLGEPERLFAPVWVEQTAWALLGQAAGCQLFDPEQIAIPRTGPPAGASVVALHFVAPVRHLLPLYTGGAECGEPSDVPSDVPPPALGRLPASRCRALDLAAGEVRRRLSRLF